MSWIHAIRERLADAFLPGNRDTELAEEIRHHLEVETEKQQQRGLNPRDARARALKLFGNPMNVREATRDARGQHWWNGCWQDVRWSTRSLRKNAGFTSLSLLTLALGIGATTVAFAVLDTVLLRPLPYREPGRLVVIEEQTAKQATRAPSFPNFIDWRAQNTAFTSVASEQYPFTETVVVAGEPMLLSVMGVSQNFFATIGMTPMLGREFTPEESSQGGPHAVMVTYDFWKSKLNSNPNIDSLSIDGSPIVGVLSRGFRLEGEAQLFYPHERAPGTVRNAHNYLVVGRLKPGASIASARADMKRLSRELKATYGDATEAVDVKITPLHEYLFGSFTTLTFTVFGAAALVLLISCTNLLTAQLARGFVRAREVSVRSALGASRSRIVRQLFIESAMLSALGAVLGIVVAFALTRLVRAVGGTLVPRLSELSVDGRVLIFSILVTAFTALLIGIYPSIRLSRTKSGNTLRSASQGGGSAVRQSVWTTLIGFEVALAVVLLVGSSMLVRTLHNILTADTGIDPHGVITAALDPGEMKPAELERIRTELAAVRGVESAAFVTAYPLSWGSESAPVTRPIDAPNVWPAFAGFRVVSPQYFSVLKQPILRGRAFGDADVLGTAPVAIVTPGIAKALWPNEDPIGKLIHTNYLQTPWLTVVGVAQEASNWKTARGSQNEIYTAFAQQKFQFRHRVIAVIRTSGSTDAIIPLLRDRLHTLAPMMPPVLNTLSARIETSASDRRFAMIALSAFAVIAVALAGIGIYGVISYSVAARQHEIGIRLALGATPAGVQRFVLRSATIMALSGVSLGIAGCLFAGRYLQSILYGVSQVDAVAYAIGAIFLFITAMLGAYFPARRSSRIDPLEAMRGE